MRRQPLLFPVLLVFAALLVAAGIYAILDGDSPPALALHAGLNEGAQAAPRDAALPPMARTATPPGAGHENPAGESHVPAHPSTEGARAPEHKAPAQAPSDRTASGPGQPAPPALNTPMHVPASSSTPPAPERVEPASPESALPPGFPIVLPGDDPAVPSSVLIFRLSPAVDAAVNVTLTSETVQDNASSTTSYDAPARANASGEFRVTGLRPKVNKIEIRAPGYRPKTVDIAPQPGQDLDLGVVTLDAGALVEGVVVTHDKTPIFGAKVFVATGGHFSGGGTVYAESGVDGSFRLTGLADGSYSADVRHKEYRRMTVSFKVKNSLLAAPLEVVMTFGGEVRGWVSLAPALLGADGKLPVVEVAVVPASHYRLNGSEADREVLASAFTYGQRKVKASDFGEFAVDRLKPGKYIVLVGVNGRYTKAKQDVEVKDAESVRVDFSLE